MDIEFTFENLPTNTEELKKLKEYDLRTPFKTAALTILALDLYSKDKEEGINMLNALKGPQPLTKREIDFIRDRFMDKDYVPRSYYKGATPENNYQGTKPTTIIVSESPYTYEEDNYAKVYLTSGGADSKRQIKLRLKDEKWYLWEEMVLSDIRKPASLDPWA